MQNVIVLLTLLSKKVFILKYVFYKFDIMYQGRRVQLSTKSGKIGTFT